MSEEYVQSYTANYRTGYDFWKNKKGEDGEINGKEVNLKQITIVRKGRTKKDKKGNIPVAETLVLQLAISPCPGGDPVFSFQPRYLLVSKTKAKRKEKDENIDITVDLQIQSAWIDSKQNAHNQVVASLSIPFKNIIVGETYSAETQSNDDWKMFVANHSTGWVFGVPVSTNIKGQITGNGVYSITAKVTEFDDYGERVYKKLAYFIDSNTDKVVGWIPSRD